MTCAQSAIMTFGVNFVMLKLKQRKGQCILFTCLCIFTIYYSYFAVLNANQDHFENISRILQKNTVYHHGQGYQNKNGDTQTEIKKAYVVNTPSCQIPDLNPWDKDTYELNKKCGVHTASSLASECGPSDEIDPECHKLPVPKWMYAQDSYLVTNYSAILESGYSRSSIHCCYKVIYRVEQSLESFDTNADNVVKYSKECYHIPAKDKIKIVEEFIRVFCSSKSLGRFDDVYREYFAFAQPDAHALKKMDKWTGKNASEIPPSIVIVGLDTNSRLNSHRRLKRTLNLLKQIGAIEMFGYTKVADNTLPNTVAFLTGMPQSEMLKLCYEKTNYDNCPFLWKDFDKAGYLTVTAEDAPLCTGFNHRQETGFVKKPTDFYYRPFALALREESDNTTRYLKCIGRYLSPEMVLNYVSDTLRHRAPVFVHTWFTVFGHACINSVQFVDDPVTKFLKNVKKNNTIIIVMGDHGDTHGPFRETTLGWYEDKLPAMWVYLPDSVRAKYPEWKSALQINSKRLTSHFDLYHTFVQVLKAYNPNPSFVVNTPKIQTGQSLLEPVPENRTCQSAGIPAAYCACMEPLSIDVSSKDEFIRQTVKAVTHATIAYLVKILPRQCAIPKLKRMVSGKVVNVPQSLSTVYIFSMYTEPGDFLFEVTAKAINDKGENMRFEVESLSDILRMNKITRKVPCVGAVLERYCYCL